MTDQAPELLRCPTCRMTDAQYKRNLSWAGCTDPWHGDDHLRRPTPAERPVARVREALEKVEEIAQLVSEYDVINSDWSFRKGVIYECIGELRRSLTARPSDAAVAWPSRDAIAKIIEDNIYRKPNGNWDGDFQDLLVAADEIRALPPDKSARESGLTIEHRLQAVRATAIEECELAARGPVYKEIYNGGEGHNWSRDSGYGKGRHDAADAIRALEPARVTPSTDETTVLPERTIAQWFLDNHQEVDLSILADLTDLIRRARVDGQRLVTPSTVGGEALPADWIKYVPDIVKNAMLTMWNYICDDTKCHPLDIEHGKGKFLTFEPKHWAQFAGDMVAKNIADLIASPTIASEKECGKAGEDDCSCGGGDLSGHDPMCPYAAPPPASLIAKGEGK